MNSLLSQKCYRESRRSAAYLFGVLAVALACVPAHAGLLLGSATDKNNEAVKDAVIFATAVDAPAEAAKAPAQAVVTQENYTITPYVTVIRAGTSVRFPNRDAHEHHIKSFSPTKTFEQRISNKREEPPILFDKTGEVALVCHFHDWMRGYIYVVDTPFYGKTDKAGNAVLNDLPAGKYEIKAWTPSMLSAPLTQTVQIGTTGSTSVKFHFDFVPKPAPAPRPPKAKPAAADYGMSY